MSLCLTRVQTQGLKHENMFNSLKHKTLKILKKYFEATVEKCLNCSHIEYAKSISVGIRETKLV